MICNQIGTFARTCWELFIDRAHIPCALSKISSWAFRSGNSRQSIRICMLGALPVHKCVIIALMFCQPPSEHAICSFGAYELNGFLTGKTLRGLLSLQSSRWLRYHTNVGKCSLWFLIIGFGADQSLSTWRSRACLSWIPAAHQAAVLALI